MEDRINDVLGQIDDDSDMKIVDERFFNRAVDSSDPDAQKELENLRRTGALSRAGTLGRYVAECIKSIDKGAGAPSEDHTIALHRQIMIVFAAVETFKKMIHDDTVSHIAINALYDSVKRDDRRLYDAVYSGGAFTFYGLRLRNDGDALNELGESFASFCGDERSSELASLGKRLFLSSCEQISRYVEDAKLND